MRQSSVVSGLVLVLLVCNGWADSPKDTNKATLDDDLKKLEGAWKTAKGPVNRIDGEVRFELAREDGHVTHKRINLDMRSPWGSKAKLRATFELREEGKKRLIPLVAGEFSNISGTIEYRFDGDTLFLLVPEGQVNFVGEHKFERVEKKK